MKLIYVLFIIALLFPRETKAISTDKYAHLGVAYMLSDLSYDLFRKWGMPHEGSLVFSSVGVSFVGLIKEGWIDSKPDNGDLLFNTIGVGLHIVTKIEF